jgi:hypothetical protein
MENIEKMGISIEDNGGDTQIDSKGVEELQKLERLKDSYIKLSIV